MPEQSLQTLLSVLTAEPWKYDDDKCFISFKPDGTGEVCPSSSQLVVVIETKDPIKQAKLWAAVEFSLYLGASFDWKFQDPQSSELPIDTNTTTTTTRKQQQRLIHNLNIEIKITKRPVVVFYSSDQRKVTPENTLMEEEAFQAKTFTVHMERGVFPTPVCAQDPKSFPDARKFGLQLVFDESPYPPPEVWMPERRSLTVWKWVRFGARDLGPWNASWLESCVVM